MINVFFYKNKDGNLCGFEFSSHAQSKVCAAVSALVINTANSIGKFSGSRIVMDYNENGGFLKMIIQEPDIAAKLLLESLELGINSLKEQHKRQIRTNNIIISKEKTLC